MEKGYRKGRDVAFVLEQAHRDERKSRNADFAIDESEDHETANHKQSDDFCGVPWKYGTTKVKA